MFTRYNELRDGFLSAIEKLPDYKRAAAWEFVKALEARAATFHDDPLTNAAPELLNGCNLAVMMLGVEARMHRENQAPKKAEAVQKAIEVICAAIAKAESTP